MFEGVTPMFNVGGGHDLATAALLNQQNNSPWQMMPWLVFAWLFRQNGFGYGGDGFPGANAAYNSAIAGQTLTASQVDSVRNEVGRILSEVQSNSQTGREILSSIQSFAASQGLANCATREAILEAAQNVQNSICCNASTLAAAINGVSKDIMQASFATERGFQGIQGQLASCCCDIKTQLLQNQNATNNGFAQIGFASQTQSAATIQAIKDEGSATRALLTQYHCEDQQNQLLRENQALRDQLNNNNLTSQVALLTQQLNAISAAVAKIPTTTTTAAA